MPCNLNTLRNQIKIKLQNLTPEFCLAASQKITDKIIKSKVFRQSKNIACYIPIENEIDIWPIIKTIWLQEKNCYLPAFDLNKKNSLRFIKFDKNDKLINTKYKILEPNINQKQNIIIEPQNLDLVIVPLLGFSKDKFRLGRGGGYYDRTFNYKLNNPKAKPHLLGVGYKYQCIEFKTNSWDVEMDEIVFY